MGMVTIRNSDSSWMGYADEVAKPIWNGNTNITIGGIARSQTDSQRLEITLTVVGKQSEIKSLMDVIKDFRKEVYFTPSRILYDKSSVEEIRVTIDGSPDSRMRGRDGEILYEVELKLVEVI